MKSQSIKNPEKDIKDKEWKIHTLCLELFLFFLFSSVFHLYLKINPIVYLLKQTLYIHVNISVWVFNDPCLQFTYRTLFPCKPQNEANANYLVAGRDSARAGTKHPLADIYASQSLSWRTQDHSFRKMLWNHKLSDYQVLCDSSCSPLF